MDTETLRSLNALRIQPQGQKHNKVWCWAVQRTCQWLNCRLDRTQPAASLPHRPAVLGAGSLGKHNKHWGQSILCKAMFASLRRVWISLLICVTVRVWETVRSMDVHIRVCACVFLQRETIFSKSSGCKKRRSCSSHITALFATMQPLLLQQIQRTFGSRK